MALYIKTSSGWFVVDGTDGTEPTPSGFVDLVPALTSNSAGGYVVSATSEYSESGQTASAYKAFDRVVDGNWNTTWNAGGVATVSAPKILTIETPSAIEIKMYSVQIRLLANTLCPKAWKLQGWDGSAWVDIHTASKPSWYDGEIQPYMISSSAAYSKHRLYITDSGVQCEIAEVRFYG